MKEMLHCVMMKIYILIINGKNQRMRNIHEVVTGVSGNGFLTLGTGTGIAQPLPKFWERERE